MSDNRLPDAKPPPPPTTATPLDDRAASSPAHLSSPTTSPRRPVSPSESPKSPPPKRMRRSRQPEEREAQSSPSPSVSSSPEDEPAEGSRGTRGQSASAPSAGPPKKKRTRTLTTPHQSAVLHAMLAQSRFPTTAMREQVGKQIGLSARKVQVWFQNQRQKARRPKAESETPLTRPPQYGPFPNTQAQTHQEMAGSSHVLSAPVSRSGSSSAIAGPSSLRSPAEPRPFSRGADDFRVSGQSAQSSPLAGPGVPGPGAGFDTYVRGVTPSPMGAMHLPRFPAHIVAPSSSSPSQDFHAMHGISPIYPGNSPPRSILGPSISSRTRSPIILPPLQFDARRGRDPFEFAQPPRSLSSPSSGASISPTTSLHPRDPQPSPTTQSLPPPFTLQPAPRWAPDLYPPSRPSSSPRPGSSSYAEQFAGPSFQPDTRHQFAYDLDRPTPSISRAPRFDPVRASSEERPVHPRRPFSRSPDNDNASK